MMWGKSRSGFWWFSRSVIIQSDTSLYSSFGGYQTSKNGKYIKKWNSEDESD